MLHTRFKKYIPYGFWKRRLLKSFTICGGGGHLGHVAKISRINLSSRDPVMLLIYLSFDRPSGSEKKMDIYMYITQRKGQIRLPCVLT